MPRFFKRPLPVTAYIIEDDEIVVTDRDGRRSVGRAGWVAITGPHGEQYSMRPSRFLAYFDPDPNDPEAIGLIESLKQPRS